MDLKIFNKLSDSDIDLYSKKKYGCNLFFLLYKEISHVRHITKNWMNF